MQPDVSKMGGFLRTSFFSSLIFFNFIITICFVLLIAFEGLNKKEMPKAEAIEQNPLPQSVSAKTAMLIP